VSPLLYYEYSPLVRAKTYEGHSVPLKSIVLCQLQYIDRFLISLDLNSGTCTYKIPYQYC